MRVPPWRVALLLVLTACSGVDLRGTQSGERSNPVLTVVPAPLPDAELVPGHAPEQIPPPGPYPPRVIEMQPRTGEEVPPDAVVVLSFDQPMDQRSVEASFTIRPETSGSFLWSSDPAVETELVGGSIVQYSPDSLLAGQRYVVSLGGDARSAAGLALGGDVQTAFRVLSPLRVTRTEPADGDGEVWTDASIEIEFDRPVVPLACVGVVPDEDAGCLELPLTLTSDTDATDNRGNGLWTGVSTYRFGLAAGLQAGHDYVATLAPAVVSSDGAGMDEPYVWTFATAVPRVVAVGPDPGARGVAIDGEIWVRFSTPMDDVETSAALGITGPDGQSVSGALTWRNDSTVLVFTPAQRLSLGAVYTATVGQRARAYTSVPIDRPYAWMFGTVTQPRLLTQSPSFGAGRENGFVDVNEPLRLAFSGAFEPEALIRAVRVSPEPPEGALHAWYDENANTVTLMWTRDPQSQGCITVDPTVTDVYGNPLGNTEGFCYETGDLSPRLELAHPTGAVTLHGGHQAALQMLNSNVASARFALSEIDLPQFTASGPALGRLVREWTASFEPELNVTKVVTVPLDRAGETLPTGLYALSWQLTGQSQVQRTVRLAVVDRNILVKVAGEEALVWVTESGGVGMPAVPVTRTGVQLVDREALLLAGGTTDSDGLVRLPIPARSALWEPVVALTGSPGEDGFGIALTSWGTEGWGFREPEVFPSAAPGYRAYLQVDRPVYAAGDVVQFVGVLRRDLAGAYELPKMGTEVVLALTGPDGQSVYSAVVEVSPTGLFSGTLGLPRYAPTGNYSI
ncbi:MAG: Ig-like domain-containing protein, partial [Anaerolineae bacterium]|nr:Ig-like domain-containing protein [Anaerolineae bacterium]